MNNNTCFLQLFIAFISDRKNDKKISKYENRKRKNAVGRKLFFQ